MMRKPGFTLLETMIALGIVVLALGAGATINRSILIGGQTAEDTFHANQLADNVITMLKGTQSYVFNRVNPGDNRSLETYFGLNGTTVHPLIPYRNGAQGPENNYLTSWCVDTAIVNACESSITSKIGGTRTIGQDFADVATAGSETIAVNREVVTLSTTEYRNTIDYLTQAGGNIPLFTACGGACYWDYFSRKTTIQKLPAAFLGNATGTGSAYQVVVEVTNLRTRTKITRIALLTDFGVAGNTGANGSASFFGNGQQGQGQQGQQGQQAL
ncbi:hypothetical protein BH11PAT4_BH11PAT4_3150 [soil metagenome]